MNFRYKVANEDIIVSQEEHERIQAASEAGATKLSLRDGKLGVNLAHFQFFTETNEKTKTEEDEYRKFLALPMEDRPSIVSSYLPKPKEPGFSKAIGGNKKECVLCREFHVIPDNRDKCLPCNMK